MKKEKNSTVWYASEERVKGTSKLVVLDDIGVLEISETGIVFKGKREKIQISRVNIKNMSLIRQKIPWIMYLVCNVIAILVFVYEIELNIILGIILIIIGNGLGLLVALGTKWILIEHVDQQGNPQKSYFADGDMLGWAGIFGGTKKLYEAIKHGEVA